MGEEQWKDKHIESKVHNYGNHNKIPLLIFTLKLSAIS